MAGKFRNLYYNVNHYLLSWLPDNIYHNVLGLIMHRRFGIKYHWMNIQNPKTFSEKLQWLKSHGDTSIKTILADKYEVREFVKKRIGEKYLVELLPLAISENKGQYIYAVDDAEQIDFDILPSQFAMKLTKGSGYNIICSNKAKLDVNYVRTQMSQWLKVDNYLLSREPQYKGKNRIICERLLEYNITDYKFFCFNGEPKFVELYIDRFGDHKKVFYTMDWQKAGFITGGDDINGEAQCPERFEDMKLVAKKLSKDFNFVRVDLYQHDGDIYFGELTFHPAGGYTPITPRDWEYRLGDMIKL